MPNVFDASASLLGYLYQCRSALLLALREGRNRPDVKIYVERFDDVAFGQDGDIYSRVQLKHTLSSSKSLTDKSPDLWKTLRIWSEAAYTGELSLSESALVLITVASASDDSIAGRLGPTGRDEIAAQSTLTAIAKGGGSQENAAGYEAFLALSSVQRRNLVRAIKVFAGSGDINAASEMLKREVTYIIGRKYVSAFIERLEGWWINRVIIQLSSEETEPIRSIELESHILDIQSQFEAENLTIDHILSVPIGGVDASTDDRLFVKQLRLVSLSNPRIASAILDYYRAVQQRSTWLSEDQLMFDELEGYEARLVDEWQRRFNQMLEDLSAVATEDQLAREGRQLFNWFETQADIPIRPKCREPYVLRGNYHFLANNENPDSAPRIGWHPQFIERIKELIAQAVVHA